MKKINKQFNDTITSPKKLIKTAGNIFIISIFLIALLLLISSFNPGGLRALSVKSGSMSPVIFTGSLVFVYPADSYSSGEIVTFRTQGREELITHRIVNIHQLEGQTLFTTQGDANEVPDSYALPENGIIGKVRLSIPLLGYVLDFAKTIPGIIILIIIPATIIIYEESRKISKEWKKIKKKRDKKPVSTKQPPKQ